MADADVEVSAFAKGLLESGYQKEWVHVIDEEPLATVPIAKSIAVIEPGDVSKLGDAVPNPASEKVTIQVYVTVADAGSRPSLMLSDLSGKEVASFKLKEGNNSIEIDTRNFSSGLYFYSMVVNGRTKDSKKLSVVR